MLGWGAGKVFLPSDGHDGHESYKKYLFIYCVCKSGVPWSNCENQSETISAVFGDEFQAGAAKCWGGGRAGCFNRGS